MHWIGAILILVLLGHGWWMTHLAPRADRFAHYISHAAMGYDLLALVILRLLWRWTHAVPALPNDLQPWERISADAGHFGLYLLTFASTLTGWALAGTFRRPMDKDLFGITVPPIFKSQDRVMHDLFEESHEILSYLLAILIVLHVLGALQHHLIKHHDVLWRMWFGPKSG